MTVTHYLAIADQAVGESGWSIEFREFPEIASDAESEAAIPEQARDALLTVIDFRTEGRKPIPPALTEAVDPPPAGVTRRVLVMVPVVLPSAPVRVNISVDQTLLRRIDAAAERLGMTRSGMLAEGARRLIEAPPD